MSNVQYRLLKKVTNNMSAHVLYDMWNNVWSNVRRNVGYDVWRNVGNKVWDNVYQYTAGDLIHRDIEQYIEEYYE